jgi:hypothetical protein
MTVLRAVIQCVKELHRMATAVKELGKRYDKAG